MFGYIYKYTEDTNFITLSYFNSLVEHYTMYDNKLYSFNFNQLFFVSLNP